jgi:hypothetical protein
LAEDVVGHEQIEVAVCIEVQETSTGAHLFARRHTGRLGHVRERAVPVISVKEIRPEIVQVKVRIPIVVVITHADSQMVGTIGQTGGHGHVGELPTAIVSIERIARRRFRHRSSGQRGPVQEQNIDPAIIVVIERGKTRSNGFNNEPASRTAVGVYEINAGLPCHFLELNRTGCFRRGECRQEQSHQKHKRQGVRGGGVSPGEQTRRFRGARSG